jgi:alpha-tubulin N-acetyltransferase 1
MGIGKIMFEHMLKEEQIHPHKLAYDRPSPKLVAFLAKHYHLKDYIPQSNNFVVFKKYFSGVPVLNPSSMASISMRPLTARGDNKNKVPEQTTPVVDSPGTAVAGPSPSDVSPPISPSGSRQGQRQGNPITDAYKQLPSRDSYSNVNKTSRLPQYIMRSTRPF